MDTQLFLPTTYTCEVESSISVGSVHCLAISYSTLYGEIIQELLGISYQLLYCSSFVTMVKVPHPHCALFYSAQTQELQNSIDISRNSCGISFWPSDLDLFDEVDSSVLDPRREPSDSDLVDVRKFLDLFFVDFSAATEANVQHWGVFAECGFLKDAQVACLCPDHPHSVAR